ncbi:MAG: hypothetical protein ACI9JN_002194 [Bacteroidia bacterium]
MTSLIFKIEQGMKLKKLGVFVACWLLTTMLAFGQIGLKPLNQNPTIQSYLKQHPSYTWSNASKHGKWGQIDTLHLPFFDDFTITSIYPDSSRWQDNEVYVNRDFGVHPPSYGVATFDYLDLNGKPYASIERETLDYGDTLTSQHINLSVDAGGTSYKTGDTTFFLSFYYQAKGLGDFITVDDSLKLLFKDKDGHWNHMWGVKGEEGTDFIQVLVQVLEEKYFYDAFQFQFVNLTHRWGNNNHWHIDNVYLNRDRSKADLYALDYAIQSKPTSMLKNFYSMPYDHFLADVTEAEDSFYFYVANRQQAQLNTVVRYVDKQGTNVLFSTLFDDNAANVPGSGYALRKVPAYNYTNLVDTAYPIVVTREYYARGKSVTNVPIFQANDNITVEQVFDRHYAYDDGTAESGFGFNDLRTGDGRIVLEFDLKKADTLRAVDFMLTYNTQDVGRQRFVFQIYKDIAFNGGTDDLVFERAFVGQDIYDGIDNRGFFTIGLDTAIALEKGKFYIGWSQEKNYNLTVGFDKNNGYIKSQGFNKHIYFNVGDGWLQNSNKNLVGAPMIRPIVGSEDPWNVSVNKPKLDRVVHVYPNPTDGKLMIDEDVKSIRVMDIQGKNVQVRILDQRTIDLDDNPSGLYFITIETNDNRFIHTKVIKR